MTWAISINSARLRFEWSGLINTRYPMQKFRASVTITNLTNEMAKQVGLDIIGYEKTLDSSKIFLKR